MALYGNVFYRENGSVLQLILIVVFRYSMSERKISQYLLHTNKSLIIKEIQLISTSTIKLKTKVNTAHEKTIRAWNKDIITYNN